jgi:hypothetical protein
LLRDVRRRLRPPALEKGALRRHRLAVVGHQPQKAELRERFLMGGDEGPLALPAHQQVFRRQFVDRLADGALADLEARREFQFARDRLAGLPLALLQSLHEQRLDLLVERQEHRIARSFRGRRTGGIGGHAGNALRTGGST